MKQTELIEKLQKAINKKGLNVSIDWITKKVKNDKEIPSKFTDAVKYLINEYYYTSMNINYVGYYL